MSEHETTPASRKSSVSVPQDRIVQIVLTAIMAMCLWYIQGISTTVRDHSEALAAIHANRFTNEDGLEVWKEIGKIRIDMALLPKEVPPQWFLDRVIAIDKRLAVIESEIRKLAE